MGPRSLLCNYHLGKCWAYNLRVIWMSHNREHLDAAWKEIATSRRSVETIIKDPHFHAGELISIENTYTLKNVLYGILGPYLLGLTVAV